MTHWHQPLSIAGETSPVYAREISQKQSCAPSLTVVPSSTSAIPSNHGNGGKMDTSTRSGFAVDAGSTPLTRSRASPALTGFIFQLAASRALGLTRAGKVSLYASFRIATPGSSLPSRYSSVAPPPVDTQEKRPASPSCSTAAAVSPPPTRV